MNLSKENSKSEENHDSKTNFLSNYKEDVLVMLDNRKGGDLDKSKQEEIPAEEVAVMVNNFTGNKNISSTNMILDVDEHYLVNEDEYGSNMNFKDEQVISNVNFY